MEVKELTYRQSQIRFRHFGKGPRKLLCFHGYGENSAVFEFLGKYLEGQFEIIAPDIPFHGETQWKEGLEVSPADLVSMVNFLLGNDKDRFDLVGFSLGGRLALSLYQCMPERIGKILLLAPDGLKMNGWYWLATQTWAGNRLFAFTMNHPGWYFGLLKLLSRTGLINASIYKFVNYYIGNREVRDQLYTRWTGFRKLKPDIRQIRQLIRDQGTSMRLVYGKHDRIILPAPGEKFRKGIETHCSIDIIESGHQVLHEKHAAAIVQNLTR